MAKKCSLASCQATMLQLLLFVDKICKEKQLIYWIDGGTLLGAVRHKGFIPWDDDIDVCLLASDYKILIEELEKVCQRHDFYSLFYHIHDLDYWCEYLGDRRVLAHGILSSRIDLIPVKSIADNDDAKAKDISLANIGRFFIKGAFKEKEAVLADHLDKYLKDVKSLSQAKALFFKDYFSYLQSHSSIDKNLLYTYSFNDMLVAKKRRYYTHEDIFPVKRISFEGHELFAPNNIDGYLSVLYGENYMSLPPKEKQKPFADIYFYNNQSKAKTNTQLQIFLSREDKHFIARMHKNKLLRYKEKFISFAQLSYNCIKNGVFYFWFVHLKFIIKKTIFGARF